MLLGFILVCGPTNTIFILEQLQRNVYSKLSYMEVSLGQLKRKIRQDYRGIIQGTLDGCQT